MRHSDSLTAIEIDRLGFRALSDALGLAGALRFLRQIGGGSGDYTHERKTILRGVTIESLSLEARSHEKRRVGRKRGQILRR